MGDYRKLEVWQLASSLSDRVDVLVDQLPARLQKGLGDQLSRAAESIHLNLAEGCGLNSDAQLAKHVRVALGSANELEDGLAKLERRRLIPREDWDIVDDATVLRKKLGALLRRLTTHRLARSRKPSPEPSPEPSAEPSAEPPAEPRAEPRAAGRVSQPSAETVSSSLVPSAEQPQ